LDRLKICVEIYVEWSPETDNTVVNYSILLLPGLPEYDIRPRCGQIQKLTGKINPGEIGLYILPDLERGQML